MIRSDIGTGPFVIRIDVYYINSCVQRNKSLKSDISLNYSRCNNRYAVLTPASDESKTCCHSATPGICVMAMCAARSAATYCQWSCRDYSTGVISGVIRCPRSNLAYACSHNKHDA